MILGLGTDLVEISRVEGLWRRNREGMLRRVFTEAEASYCESKANPGQHLAGRFAAKEAALKALGTGWADGAGLREVEVVAQASGAPVLLLHGRTGELAAMRGVTKLHLSISHAGGFAVATVVLEGLLTVGAG